MSGAIYDQHADFYVAFVDAAVAEEGGYVTTLLATIRDLLAGRLSGARICDLACGEGYVSRFLARSGPAEVVGVDLSVKLIEEARRRADAPGLTYLLDDARELRTLRDASFDIAMCQMALMDIADHRAMFRAVKHVLKPDGRFFFSLLHPCFESPFHVPEEPQFLLDEGGSPTAFVVRRYASEGYWKSGADGMRGRVRGHHRMLSTYLNDLADCGFRLERMVEPVFDDEGLSSQVPRTMVVAARAGVNRGGRAHSGPRGNAR